MVQGKESQEAEENEEVMDTNNEEEQVQEENVRLPSVPISDGGCVSVFINHHLFKVLFSLYGLT